MSRPSLAYLAEGRTVALVSDAGTPPVSTRAVGLVGRGGRGRPIVTAVPGPSSAARRPGPERAPRTASASRAFCPERERTGAAARGDGPRRAHRGALRGARPARARPWPTCSSVRGAPVAVSRASSPSSTRRCGGDPGSTPSATFAGREVVARSWWCRGPRGPCPPPATTRSWTAAASDALEAGDTAATRPPWQAHWACPAGAPTPWRWACGGMRRPELRLDVTEKTSLAAATSSPPDRDRRSGLLRGRYPKAVAPLLRHHAHLLRERRAAHRARLHDRRRRRARPLAPPAAATTSSSSPAPTSTARRSRRPPRPTGSRPPEWVDAVAGVFRRGVGRARHLQRRLHPHHRAAPRRGGAGVPADDLRHRRHRAQGTYEGSYCVPCEDYYTEERARRRQLPDPRPPGRARAEENYFFKLSPFEDRLLEYYEAHPDAVQPERKRNEVLGLHQRRACEDFSISPRRRLLGHPAAVGREHVVYVWFDALINYITAVGYGDDPAERFARGGPPTPPHRQGHPPVPLRVLAGDAAWRRAWTRRARVRARLAARGGEKMSKSKANPIAPARSRRRLRRRRASATTSCATALRARRRLLLRGDQRYNADLANNFGNLVARVATVVGSKCDGLGPAPDPDSRLLAVAADRASRTPPLPGRSAAPRCVGGDVATHPRDQRRARGDRALESRPRSRVDKVLGSALEALRIVACWLSRPCPRRAPRSGAGSACRAGPTIAGCRPTPPGAVSRWPTVEKAPPLFPWCRD